MSKKNRIDAIDALVTGSPTIQQSGFQPALHRESAAARSAANVSGPRGQLLELTHATRLLDTALREFVHGKLIPLAGPPALGTYLTALVNHHTPNVGRLVESRRARFQQSIVNQRNRFMHDADRYPSKMELETIVVEMHSCLQEVLAL